jgi:hypothetical protein
MKINSAKLVFVLILVLALTQGICHKAIYKTQPGHGKELLKKVYRRMPEKPFTGTPAH